MPLLHLAIQFVQVMERRFVVCAGSSIVFQRDAAAADFAAVFVHVVAMTASMMMLMMIRVRKVVDAPCRRCSREKGVSERAHRSGKTPISKERRRPKDTEEDPRREGKKSMKSREWRKCWREFGSWWRIFVLVDDG